MILRKGAMHQSEKEWELVPIMCVDICVYTNNVFCENDQCWLNNFRQKSFKLKLNKINVDHKIQLNIF